ncbi:DNA-invertase hin [Candidatus Termititenax persephonae]|uniref:DNA-invertase hin n=1 Tax=Candidatus Termititenax persephonae TaxID=2218525 RepID=A0A388TJ13_9BACT|nr:DNA-invertase hin [Candidatus Termititenax persephonae]
MVNKEQKEYRCVIYARVSDKKQLTDVFGNDKDINSIQNQITYCESYINLRKQALNGDKWEIVDKYLEEGKSAKDIKHRPVYKQMIEDGKKGKYNCIIVYKLDRITRSIGDFYNQMKTFFDEYDVSLISATQELNTATSQGRLVLNMLLSFAQFERETTSDRVKDTRNSNILSGKWPGGIPPLGYTLKDGKVLKNQNDIVKVKEIFEQYKELRNLDKVAQYVNSRGWRTKENNPKKVNGRKTGGQKFDKRSIKSILINPIYIGKWSVGSREKNLMLDKPDYIDFDKNLAIVDENLFYTCKGFLMNNRNASTRNRQTKNEYLLSGLIKLKGYDMPFTGEITNTQRKKSNSYYICNDSLLPKPKRLPVKEFDAEVINQIKSLYIDNIKFNYVYKKGVDLIKEQTKIFEDRKNSITHNIGELTAEEKSLIKSIDEGGINAMSNRLREIQEQKDQLNDNLKSTLAEIARIKGDKLNHDILKENLKYIYDHFEKMSFKEKETIIACLVNQIIYDESRGEIEIQLNNALGQTFDDFLKTGKGHLFVSLTAWRPRPDSNGRPPA